MGRTCEIGSHTFLIVWVLFSSIAQQNLPCEGELGYKHSANLPFLMGEGVESLTKFSKSCWERVG